MDKIEEKSCYAILEKDDKKFLIDLKKIHEMVDIGPIREEILNEIVKYMRVKKYFVGTITQDDLPVLMVIMNDFERKGIDYTGEQLGDEFSKAKNLYLDNKDGKNYNVYTEFDAEIRLEKMEKENYFFKEDYLRDFFKYVIFNLKRVESYYLSLNPEEQEIFIEEYYKISSYSEHKTFGEDCSHFRTASPIINAAVLKKEFKNEA